MFSNCIHTQQCQPPAVQEPQPNPFTVQTNHSYRAATSAAVAIPAIPLSMRGMRLVMVMKVRMRGDSDILKINLLIFHWFRKEFLGLSDRPKLRNYMFSSKKMTHKIPN